MAGMSTVQDVEPTRALLSWVIARAPIVLITMDSEGIFTSVQGDGAREVGIDTDAVVGLHIDQFQPSGQEQTRSWWRRAMAGENHAQEVAFGGHSFLAHFSPLLQGGIPAGASMVAIDITERVRAEQQLVEATVRQAEVTDYLSLILESTAEAIYAIDADLVCTSVNAATCELLGYARSELVGHDLHSLIHHPRADGSPYPSEDCPIGIRLRTDARFHSQAEVVWRKDGTSIPVEWSIQPLRTGGVTRGAVVVLHDIRARIASEQEAALHAARQAAVIDLGRRALAGSSEDELLNAALSSLYSLLDLDLALAYDFGREERSAVVRAAVTSGDRQVEIGTVVQISDPARYRGMVQDSGPFVVRDHLAEPSDTRSDFLVDRAIRSAIRAAIPGDGRPLGVICLYSHNPRDWTDGDLEVVQLMTSILSVAMQRDRSEEQRRLLLSRLVRAQETERREIAEDIHDDAVQVMTAANLRIQILRQRLPDGESTEAVEQLQQSVSAAIHRLRNLLFDLAPPALESYGLARAVKAALDQLHASTGIETSLEDDIHVELDMAHRILLYRAIQEAIGNVRAHAAATRIKVILRDQDEGISAIIRDNGIGFFVAEASVPRARQLGIRGMRERIDLLGGRLTVESTPGRGTTVRMWAPAPLADPRPVNAPGSMPTRAP